MRASVDTIHFLITMESWIRTPSNKELRCAGSRPSQLIQTSSLRRGGAAINQELQINSQHREKKKKKKLPTSLQDHCAFQHLEIKPYQGGHLQIQAANNEYLSLRLGEPQKAFQQELSWYKWLCYHISLLSFGGRQRRQASTVKGWVSWLRLSLTYEIKCDKAYKALYTSHFNKHSKCKVPC